MGGCYSEDGCRVDTPFPIGVWTIPEVGYYGLTQAAAIKEGYDAEVGVASYEDCLRGRVFAPDGMLKLVFDRASARILGVHIIGKDACELVHYGMDLVDKQTTIFEVIDTLFTAVTFHELFKEAALNGNSKLEFGIQWQELISELRESTLASGEIDEDHLRRCFNDIDVDGSGALDESELTEVFNRSGASDVQPSVVATLFNLADEDGNGTIEWEEFVRLFRELAPPTKAMEAEEEAEEEQASILSFVDECAEAYERDAPILPR